MWNLRNSIFYRGYDNFSVIRYSLVSGLQYCPFYEIEDLLEIAITDPSETQLCHYNFRHSLRSSTIVIIFFQNFISTWYLTVEEFSIKLYVTAQLWYKIIVFMAS
jgi:hypothetical protein